MAPLPAPRRIPLPSRRGTGGSLALSVHEAGAGPAVVMCHGFPELGYSWRHQVGALAEAGFRAIAPDQRGYGGSDCPDAIEDYDLQHLTADLVACSIRSRSRRPCSPVTTGAASSYGQCRSSTP